MVTDAYYKYVVAKNAITKLLGIKDIHINHRPETRDHLVLFLEWLAKELVNDGEIDTWDVIKSVQDKGNHLIDRVLIGEVKAIMKDIGESQDNIDNPLEQDRFITTIIGFFSSLLTQLKIQYNLGKQEQQNGCGKCCCGEGEGQKEWEDWISGVWPEEERPTIPPAHSTSSPSNCNCSYRK